MAELKFVQMWTCSQCGDPLGKTCKKCKKHPDRKPTVVEWYSFPAKLRDCECKKSVLIPCQRDGCKGTRWVNVQNTRGRLSRSETLYCSRRCNCLVQNAKKSNSVMVPCGWCGKPCKRTGSEVKNFKQAFCRPDHYWMSLKKDEHSAKESKKKDDAIEMWCEICAKKNRDDGFQEFDAPYAGMATCKKCGTRKGQGSAPVSPQEMNAMTAAGARR